jgi:ABC-type hemin transport system ATPase subunit
MALAIRDLTLGYDRHPAVNHLDLDLAPGSLTAIVGPNGAGKSTLLKGLTGELQPLEGRIDRRAARLAYLPQLSDVDRGFPVAVGAFVAMGLWHRVGAFGRIGGGDAVRVAEALAAVGLTGFERRPISALSGGQMQRVMFTRLLLQDADLTRLRRFWAECGRSQNFDRPTKRCLNSRTATHGCQSARKTDALARKSGGRRKNWAEFAGTGSADEDGNAAP